MGKPWECSNEARLCNVRVSEADLIFRRMKVSAWKGAVQNVNGDTVDVYGEMYSYCSGVL